MAPSLKENHTILPPQDMEEMLDLGNFLNGLTEPAALVGPDGQTVPLPLEVFNILREVAGAMRHGKAITVAPVDQKLTTQEAANFLGISRPTLIKLLESQQIPYELTSGGRHRRIRLHDIVSFQEHARQDRRATLAQAVSEAEAQGHYNDQVPDYSEALRTARASLS